MPRDDRLYLDDIEDKNLTSEAYFSCEVAFKPTSPISRNISFVIYTNIYKWKGVIACEIPG